MYNKEQNFPSARAPPQAEAQSALVAASNIYNMKLFSSRVETRDERSDEEVHSSWSCLDQELDKKKKKIRSDKKMITALTLAYVFTESSRILTDISAVNNTYVVCPIIMLH